MQYITSLPKRQQKRPRSGGGSKSWLAFWAKARYSGENTPGREGPALKHKALKISAAAGLTAGAFVASGWHFFNLTVRCKRRKNAPPAGPSGKKGVFRLPKARVNHPRHRFEAEYESGKEWCRQQTMKECRITSADGLTLYGSYLPADDPARVVLLCHGYKGSGFGDFANLARFLHENRCDLLFIDQRCCGRSEGRYITFGARERYDIQDWAYFLEDKNARGLPIYLYGMSMGASGVLMASGLDLPGSVRGVIADCGFVSMERQLRDMAKNWFHLRWIGLTLLKERILCRALASFDMAEADVTPALAQDRLPTLFFHGAEDTYVPPENSLDAFGLCRAPKELVVVPGARHICANYADPALYRSKLLEFFAKYD